LPPWTSMPWEKPAGLARLGGFTTCTSLAMEFSS
jgi:hypothetical protein